ncbi:MAG: MFS transporter [Dehalococcoidia bacterium]
MAAWVVLNVYWAGTLLYGLTVFFTPVRVAFGWSTTLMALIFSIANVATGLLSPLTGVFFDRFGPRRLMLFACSISGAGLIALSRTASLTGFVAAFSLVSVGYSMWTGTGMATAGLWFSRRRGLAMGIIVAGSALGGLLVPIWQAVITGAGWRVTFLIGGIAMLGVGLPATLVLRHRPADLGLLPDGGVMAPVRTRRGAPPDGVGPVEAPLPVQPLEGDTGFWAAIHTWQFWTISVVASFILAGSTAATVLLLPRLQEAHVNSRLAVTAATVSVLLGIVGRPTIGLLADRRPIPALAVLVFSLQAVCLLAFALAPQRLPVLLLFVVGFGLSNDGVRMLASLLMLRYFGTRAFGRILGVHLVVVLPGRVLGPVIAGALHDSGHGYSSGFLLFAVISLAMTAPAAILRPPGKTALR